MRVKSQYYENKVIILVCVMSEEKYQSHVKMREMEHFVKLYFGKGFTNKEILHLCHISTTVS